MRSRPRPGALLQSPTPISAKRRAGRATPPVPDRRWPRSWRRQPSRCPQVPVVSLESEGVVLIYGRDERAVDAGNLLKDHLDVTVLIKPPATIAPPRSTEFPVAKGSDPRGQRISRLIRDHCRRFCASCALLAQRAYVRAIPQRRTVALRRHPRSLRRPGAVLQQPTCAMAICAPTPNDPAAILKAVLKARDLVGTFEKPRYITFTDDLCAHSRSRIVGCTRCLDLCPTGAITPAGNHVAIDAAHLRGLRPVRRRVPDGRGLLCAAAGRRADAQAAYAADDLSRRRRRARHCSRCMMWRMASR